jgi:uncharacterized protein YgiM (DUF1202 family)
MPNLLKTRLKHAILLALAVLSLALPARADGAIVYVGDRALNLRAGPNLTFPSVAELYPGEALTVLGNNGLWLNVQRATGQSGWVNGFYVGSAPPASAIVQYKTVIVDTGNLNLRAGPGLKYPSLAEIPQGETLTVLARSGLWLNVQRANGMTGWVNKTYTRPEGVAASAPRPAATAQPSPSDGPFAVVNSSFVNLRAGPGFDFDVLAEMPRGEVLTVLGRSGDWVNVQRSDGQEGWSRESVLKLTGTAPVVASPTPSPSTSTSPSPTPTLSPVISNAFCREGGVLAGVQDPDQLRLLKPCLTVTGVVVETSRSADGNFTFRLRVNSAYSWTLNDENRNKLRGYLQVEITPADQDTVAAPAIGDRVAVTGAHVTDTVHGWNAIYPAWLVEPAP